jgi:predicted AAA+ superfamily ATPase
MESRLFKRQVVDEIVRYLHTDDIIVVQGARQVGKTCILMYLQHLLREQGVQTLYLDLEDSRFVTLLDRGVDEFLLYLRGEGFDLPAYARTGAKLYVLVDEIQYLAEPSSFMKLIADHHRVIKLIVSGSSSFGMKSKFKDSLVGRTVNFEIYPLSFQELLTFRDVTFIPGIPLTEVKTRELQTYYLEYVLYGGYPKIVLTPEVDRKERYLQQIIDTYIRKDIRDLAEIKDVNRFNHLLEVLASQSGNLINITELSNTCDLARQTIERYIFLLEQTYILRLVRPFYRNLRSEITKTPKVFFFDTGLMQMLWLKRLQTEIIGSVFETSLFAELVKQGNEDDITYWRTADKKEIDFVIRRPEGPLPVEVKSHFPRAFPSVFKSFWQADALGENKPFLVISLYGEPISSQMIYPWQLYQGANDGLDSKHPSPENIDSSSSSQNT